MKYNHYVSTLLLFKKPFIETNQYLVCCCSAFPKKHACKCNDGRLLPLSNPDWTHVILHKNSRV